MDKHNYLQNADISVIEQLYKEYLENRDTLDQSWQNFFDGFDFAQKVYNSPNSLTELEAEQYDKEFQVINLIDEYRRRGHLFTETNPVRKRRNYKPSLDIERFGLSDADMNTVFQAGKQIGIGAATLKDILNHLKITYCKSIGTEFMFLRVPEMVHWISTRLEKNKNTPEFSVEEKKNIFDKLNKAAGFENFIHHKFIGQKRFSLEGAETLIPALTTLIEYGAETGISEIVLGMAHRGRLNVLTNVMQKPYENIFSEFTGTYYDDKITLGDVKYHLGYDSQVITKNGKKVKLNIVPNPSHLEAADAVVEGIARAKADKKYEQDYNKICPIIIHGDAAIAGQGVVYEVIQMSKLKGYETGGSIHFVINNQIGFTTNYIDARSSTYCTDVAKVTKSPVFHVNGDDVEALLHVVKIAIDYRQKYHHDVFIDILCYRKFGHNEGDEPRFTQPLLYKAILQHPNPREVYAAKLIKEGIYNNEEIEQIRKDFNDLLEQKFKRLNPQISIQLFLKDDWKKYKNAQDEDFEKVYNTKVEKKKLIKLAETLNHQPEDKKFISKLSRITNERKKLLSENKVNWALGELLAYASLVDQGVQVRLSGQDSERGTFAHRHAAFYIEDTDEKYTPLKHISNKQAPFYVYNSPLNEYGVLGFEYGYSLATPESLTLWEAQFGDFSNVAQPVIDQFISSAEEKWGLMNGLVMLLPHGYEGQGPEHSSARIERFLALAANNNIQVANCSTPANFFHILRRQILRDFRTPLIIFTPKSLLRHPDCISSLDDLAEGHFRKVIDDNDVDTKNVKRLILCTGKIYYELLARKKELKAKDIAIVRIEELHPFPQQDLCKILTKYKDADQKLWVQEEPLNMGAWQYINSYFVEMKLSPIGRTTSGSPAHGLTGLHKIGQEEIISKAFGEFKDEYNTCNFDCLIRKPQNKISSIIKLG